MRALMIIIASLTIGAYTLIHATETLTSSLARHHATLSTIVEGARQ